MSALPLCADRAETLSTLGELIDRYLQHVKTSGEYCHESIIEREHTFGLFKARFGHLAVEACRAYQLVDWIEEHRSSWRSSSTRKAKANQVNACFNWCVAQGRIDKNPFARVRYEEADPRPAMSNDAIDRLILLANKRFERAVRFLRLTGCRLGEMCGMTWRDVDLQAGIVTLQRHKSRRHTRKAKMIVLLPEAIDLLREIRAMQPEGYDGVVMLNSRGKPWTKNTLGQHLRRMKERGEVQTDAGLHGIRHGFAVTAIANGAPLKLISAALGHQSSAVTERFYVKLGPEHAGAIREAVRLAVPRR